jgi:hypothetical protein
MELHNVTNPIRPRSQERRPEMQRSLLLAKSRTSNDTDTCCVKEAEAIELVWRSFFFLGRFHGFGREVDRWEEVHGALWYRLLLRRKDNKETYLRILAFDALHFLECLEESICAFAEAVENAIILFLV